MNDVKDALESAVDHGFVEDEVIHTLTEPLSRDLRLEQDDDGVIHHPAVYEPGEEASARQPTLYELGILMAFVRLGKAIYEGTAKWDPGHKRKRKARQTARRHQRG